MYTDERIILTAAQEKLIAALLSEVQCESIFLSPTPNPHISAFTVFDAIRNLTDPPMSEDEFNKFADSIKR